MTFSPRISPSGVGDSGFSSASDVAASPKSSHFRCLYIADFFSAFGWNWGSDAPISFPETWAFPGRGCFGGHARLSCERPDRLRVPTPSTPTPKPESQTPSTATPGAETESKSPDAPTSSNLVVPEANPASEATQPRKAAAPEILIVVSKPAQSMTVTVDGHVRYRWRVSTGRLITQLRTVPTLRFVWS